MLPFEYAVRNLLRDPGRFFLKSSGAALVVALVLVAGSFNQGMERMLKASGSPENVIFLGAGSEESVERSEVDYQAEALIASGVRGIERKHDQPIVSGEIHFMGPVSIEANSRAQMVLRGVTINAFNVHSHVRIIEGRFPNSGEVMIGTLAHNAMGVSREKLSLGQTIRFEDQDFRISGVFDAPGTIMESEIWFVRNDLATATQRDALSCVVVKMESSDKIAFANLFANQRLDLELAAVSETDYYSKLSQFYAPIRWMTWLTTFLIATGAIFGGLNMLYAAFASRIRELATLQTIGFNRLNIFISLLQESLLTTMFGTAIAAVVILFTVHGTEIYFSIGTFALNIDPSLLLLGVLSGSMLGLIGVIPPAIRCLGAKLPTALRSS
jgi:putative ABC transport system permease protein